MSIKLSYERALILSFLSSAKSLALPVCLNLASSSFRAFAVLPWDFSDLAEAGLPVLGGFNLGDAFVSTTGFLP
jgi:hypothetical protein